MLPCRMNGVISLYDASLYISTFSTRMQTIRNFGRRSLAHSEVKEVCETVVSDSFGVSYLGIPPSERRMYLISDIIGCRSREKCGLYTHSNKRDRPRFAQLHAPLAPQNGRDCAQLVRETRIIHAVGRQGLEVALLP